MSDDSFPSLDNQSPEDLAYYKAIHEYETSLDKGIPITSEELINRFPQVQDRLRVFFRGRQKFGEFAGGRYRPEFVTIKDFAHYHIGEVIGWGGNASIHKVEDDRFGRIAAIKVPLKSTAGNSISLRRMEREAQLSGRLQHPHIVPIYDTGKTDTSDGELPYFTMPLVEGRSLSELLSQRSNTSANQFEFVLLFQQICQAVAYAHKQGIIHRDLKPENVMVGAFNDAYVMDWGYGKEIDVGPRIRSKDPDSFDRMLEKLQRDHPDPDKTVIIPCPIDSLVDAEARETPGTPAYLPPEIAQGGADQADKRSDVFCLGGILCAVLTGTPTFIGDCIAASLCSRAGNLDDTFARLASSGATSDLIALAKACLSPHPSERPDDAVAVASAVKVFIDQQEQAKLEAERQTAVAAQARADAEADARRDAERLAKAERQTKWLTVGLAMSVVFGLSGLAGLKWREMTLARAQELQSIKEATERDEKTQDSDIESVLKEVFTAIENDELESAARFLQRAEGRLGVSERTAVKDRVSTAKRLLVCVQRFSDLRDEADVVKSDPNHPPLSYFTKLFAEEFQKLNLSPSRESIIEDVDSSPIRSQLINALEYWASIEVEAAAKSHLIHVVREIDPDSETLERIRQSALDDDNSKMSSLVESLELEKLPLSAARLLVDFLPAHAKITLKVLRAVESRAADKFWFHFAMAAQFTDNLYGTANHGNEKNAAIQHAVAAHALRPRSLGAIRLLAGLYVQDGDDMRLHDLVDGLSPAQGASWLGEYLLGMKDYQEGQYRSAITHYATAIDRGPESDDTKLLIASCHIKLGNYKVALEQVEDILTRKPDDGHVWTAKLLCVSAMNPNLDVSTVDAFVQRCRETPDDENAIVELGMFLERSGRVWEAAACQDTHNARPHTFRANIGGVYLARGEFNENLKIFEKVENPRNPIWTYHRSFVLSCMGRFEEAKVILNETIALESESPSKRETVDLGWVRLAMPLLKAQLDGMIALEKRFPSTARIPKWLEIKRLLMTRAEAIQLGDYFSNRRAYVVATQAYDYVLSSALPLSTQTQGMSLATDRVRAAIAAAQASIGGGRDGHRANDEERKEFRKLAIKWIADELRVCRMTLSRGQKPFSALFQLWDGGDRASALRSLSTMLMYPLLEPIRDPHVIEEMPEEDRQEAKRIWWEVKSLYQKACPPLDLPYLRDL